MTSILAVDPVMILGLALWAVVAVAFVIWRSHERHTRQLYAVRQSIDTAYRDIAAFVSDLEEVYHGLEAAQRMTRGMGPLTQENLRRIALIDHAAYRVGIYRTEMGRARVAIDNAREKCPDIF